MTRDTCGTRNRFQPKINSDEIGVLQTKKRGQARRDVPPGGDHAPDRVRRPDPRPALPHPPPPRRSTPRPSHWGTTTSGTSMPPVGRYVVEQNLRTPGPRGRTVHVIRDWLRRHHKALQPLLEAPPPPAGNSPRGTGRRARYTPAGPRQSLGAVMRKPPGSGWSTNGAAQSSSPRPRRTSWPGGAGR